MDYRTTTVTTYDREAPKVVKPQEGDWELADYKVVNQTSLSGNSLFYQHIWLWKRMHNPAPYSNFGEIMA